ncbi:MAG: 5'-nucleotidase C-terminal domain-containing protein [Candidatus Izemoplasmatales bacterium]
MKKRFYWLLIATLFFAMMACVSEETTTTSNNTTSPLTTTALSTLSSSISVTEEITSFFSTTTVTTTIESANPETSRPTFTIEVTETTSLPTEPTLTTHPTTNTTTAVSTNAVEMIEIYAMNDFHGGAYSDIANISAIGQYLINEKSTSPYTLILASGDMLQGTALSNEYRGRPVIDAMNRIGFDVFVLGNHEFDWGVETIQRYQDGNLTNGGSAFPFLAANIVSTETGELLDWAEPTAIFDLNGIRVGVIGVIGSEVYGSISPSMVTGLTFLDEVATIQEYAYTLREEELCDIVIVSLHYYDPDMNKIISDFSGSYRIDAIFNGHSHTSVADTPGDAYGRTDITIPYAQASNYTSSLFTKITLMYDRSAGVVLSGCAKTLKLQDLSATNSVIDQLLHVYASDPEYIEKMSEVLAFSTSSFSKYELAPWGASVIRDYSGVDVGILNSGGFRVSMESGDVTMEELVEIYPFDNQIKSSLLTGRQLTDLFEADAGYLIFDDQVTYSNGILSLSGVPVGMESKYRIGAVDFIFDDDDFPFLEGEEVQNTNLFMRDLLAEDLRNNAGSFNPANGTSAPPVA